jgi:adenosylcobyric acid synthase
MTARTLMVQGTASSVGKSFLVAGLCRIFRQDGLRVAPFKSQNMALNAAVTPAGGEIGRAQAVQAAAAGISPHVDMNPILLKPEGQARTQVIVLGHVYGTLSAAEYEAHKLQLWPLVCDALARLRAQYDVVLIEGAGSPAEINLKACEIANMRVADAADAPVLLVGDIDRGGVFAALAGTLLLLDPDEQARITGFIINKFRGDPALLGDGLRQLEQLTNKPVLGTVPFLTDVHLPEEDSVALEDRHHQTSTFLAPDTLDLAIPEIPYIANMDDFDPFESEAGVRIRYVRTAQALGQPHAILLPGAKNTLAALDFLDASGLAPRIVQLAHAGTPVVGLCGGYQMLGHWVADPYGIEGEGGIRSGLRLLPVGTTLQPEKVVRQTQGRVVATNGILSAITGYRVEGYEIHVGRTAPLDGADPSPLLDLLDTTGSHLDGACDVTGRIFGTYLHGLFGSTAFRRAWLDTLRALYALPPTSPTGIMGSSVDPFDLLAEHLRRHLQMDKIYAALG